MLSCSIRTILPVLGAAFFLAATQADAQVTLNLTTTQATSCVAVTDAQGLQLVPGGTDLQATGVTLTGTGCGGGDSEFDADVAVPASAVAGTAFNVTWAASEAATRCTFGGTPGVTNWPVGQEACSSSAACSTPNPHVRSVTVPSAGAYAFNVTCTNATGFDEGSVTATAPPLPPQPANFALTAPAIATVGTPIQVSWSVTGAASCSGSASLNGSSVSLPGWTDTTSPAPPRSITFAQAGAYALRLDCENTAGHTLSQIANVVASVVGGDSCPAGRQTTGTVCYTYATAGTSCRANSDLTKFETLWGYNWEQTPSPPHLSEQELFPGHNYYSVITAMSKTGYVAAKFTVPLTGLPTNQIGTIYHGETMPGPNISMSITSASDCGNFAPADTRCFVNNRGPGAAAAAWKLPGSTDNKCPLIPGQSYFVNFKFTNPPATGQGCSSTTCELSTNNNHTP